MDRKGNQRNQRKIYHFKVKNKILEIIACMIKNREENIEYIK